MMIMLTGAYTTFSGHLFKETYSSETEEVSQQVGLQIIHLVSLSNHSTAGYLIKRLQLPETIGNFGYNVTIAGGDALQQLSTVVKPPSSVIFNDGGWSNPGNAFVSDNAYAEATLDTRIVHYSGFGFNVPSGYTILSVKVSVEHYEDPSGLRYIEFQISTDGGVSFLPTTHALPVRAGPGSEGTNTVDVTSDTSWTSAGANNLAVLVRSQRTGAASPPRYMRVDYISIEVQYRPSVQAFKVVVSSQRSELSLSNFTLPWDGSARTLTDPIRTVPGVVNVKVLYSGVLGPVIWAYSNSTHIVFGLGKEAG